MRILGKSVVKLNLIRIIVVKKPSNNRNFEKKYKCCQSDIKFKKDLSVTNQI